MEKISDTEYHRNTTHISKSGLDLILKAPIFYWEKYLNPEHIPEVETDALRIGKALHLFTLEPERIADGIAVMPYFNSYTNDGKNAKREFIASNAGKSIVSDAEFKMIKNMAASLRANSWFRRFIAQGEAEKTIFFNHAHNGAPCKIRMDWFNEAEDIILDIKSTEDASPRGFGRSARTYGYHRQREFYRDGANSIGANPTFVFAAVEKNPPYACAMYLMPKEASQMARVEIERGLDIYMRCRASGIWPGYGEEIVPMDFPMWK